MSYQDEIKKQFEASQAAKAKEDSMSKPPTGLVFDMSDPTQQATPFIRMILF